MCQGTEPPPIMDLQSADQKETYDLCVMVIIIICASQVCKLNYVSLWAVMGIFLLYGYCLSVCSRCLSVCLLSAVLLGRVARKSNSYNTRQLKVARCAPVVVLRTPTVCYFQTYDIAVKLSDQDFLHKQESNNSAIRRHFQPFTLQVKMCHISTSGLFDLMILSMCHMLRFALASWPWPWTFIVHRVSCDQIWTKSNNLRPSYCCLKAENLGPSAVLNLTGSLFSQFSVIIIFIVV